MSEFETRMATAVVLHTDRKRALLLGLRNLRNRLQERAGK
jgi:hypothetical protein